MQPPLSGDARHGRARRPGAPLLGAPSGPGARSSAPCPGQAGPGGGNRGGGDGGQGYLPSGGGAGTRRRRRGRAPPPAPAPAAAQAPARARTRRLLRAHQSETAGPARLRLGPGPGPGGGGVGPRPGAGVGGGGARGRSWEETFAPVPTPPRRAALWAPAAPRPAWARLLKGPRRSRPRRSLGGAGRGTRRAVTGAREPGPLTGSLLGSVPPAHTELWGIVTGPDSYPPGD